MKYLIYLNLALTAILAMLTLTHHSFVASGAELKAPEAFKASWYDEKSSCHYEGCLMANGERFDEDKISCASRQFYGQVLTIEYQGKTIECPVKDKISKTYDATRIDLSRKAFSELENLDKGLIQVVIR